MFADEAIETEVNIVYGMMPTGNDIYTCIVMLRDCIIRFLYSHVIEYVIQSFADDSKDIDMKVNVVYGVLASGDSRVHHDV